MTLIDRLHNAANECATENVNGWGNLMTEAAEEIEAWKTRCANAEDQVTASMLKGIEKRLDET